MEIRYAVDRIEEDIVTLENLETRKIEYISLYSLDFEVKEKDILIYIDGVYLKSVEETENRLKTIEEKFNRVRRKD